MTDRQLRDEVVTLVLAGHETTALVLFYTFYLLAQSPESADRLAAELRDVLGDRPPTAADVPNLRYTEWVVRESMRLYPPAWGIAREALADCEIGGYHVPKGTQLFMIQWLVHRDGRWFDDPEAFRPERWDNDLIKRLPRCAYFPFGDGPRICIGNHFAMMEAVLILATIARRYRLEIEPGQTLELLPSITLRPRHPILMRLRAINDMAERSPATTREPVGQLPTSLNFIAPNDQRALHGISLCFLFMARHSARGDLGSQHAKTTSDRIRGRYLSRDGAGKCPAANRPR